MPQQNSFRPILWFLYFPLQTSTLLQHEAWAPLLP